MTPGRPVPGTMIFGKLPAHGDFVSRGIDAATRRALDDWLSASLADALDADASEQIFEDRFDRAPAWRFVRREPSGWVAGAVVPSADRVGRRFPLLLARGGLDGREAGAMAAALERVAYAAIGGGWDADQAAAAGDAVPVADDGADGGADAATADRWWTAGSDGIGADGAVEAGAIVFPPAELAGAWPPDLLRRMVATGVAEAGAGTVPPSERFARAGASTRWSDDMAHERTATIYRMVLPDHICPFGVRAKQMLEGAGFAVDDHLLRSRAEVDAFEAEQGVDTTPQVFIGGERIGGSDDLERYLEQG